MELHVHSNRPAETRCLHVNQLTFYRESLSNRVKQTAGLRGRVQVKREPQKYTVQCVEAKTCFLRDRRRKFSPRQLFDTDIKWAPIAKDKFTYVNLWLYYHNYNCRYLKDSIVCLWITLSVYTHIVSQLVGLQSNFRRIQLRSIFRAPMHVP